MQSSGIPEYYLKIGHVHSLQALTITSICAIIYHLETSKFFCEPTEITEVFDVCVF
jgi:hypothetical protein